LEVLEAVRASETLHLANFIITGPIVKSGQRKIFHY
jgi:hypothetical protein